MNKKISGNQINNTKFIMQSSSINDDNSNNKTSQAINAETTNDKKNTAFDYKNITLTLTGEISSPWIHRNKLTRKSNNSFMENDIEDDDEQFFLNLKRNIDKNDIREDRKNNSIKDLQSKSYSSRKKKSLFSDEDENVMKRFKKCMDEKKSLCTEMSGQQLSKNSENQIHSVNNKNRSATPNTVAFQISPIAANSDMNLRMQGNDKFLSSGNTKIVTETEFEEMIYYDFPYFTPPRKDE